MRKIRMTSRTSISGMKLISGSSRPRVLRRFIAMVPAGASLALAVGEVDELDRLLLHLDVKAVDRRPEVPVEDHAGDRHDQPERRVVERDRDAVRKLDRVRSCCSLRAEDLDHAD